MTMHMTFYWSKEVSLLVSSWRTTTWVSYSFTLLTCFLASAFYQFLEDQRATLTRHLSNPSSPTETPLLLRSTPWKGSVARVAGGVFFGFNSAVGYLLMLAVMSFNGGVFLSIVCGLAAGFVAFRTGKEDSSSGLVVENHCGCS